MPNAAEVRILVCDDRMHIRKILKAVLGAMGVTRIDEADDGRVALQLIEETRALAVARNREKSKQKLGPYDLIIADWNMPNMTGIELLKVLRADRQFRNLPVLMVTAEGDREHVSTAMMSGATDFVVKPFTSEIIDAKVRGILKLTNT